MTTIIPKEGTRSRALLEALRQSPGTFYQICERAGFDIEQPRVEESLRNLFDYLIAGNARFDGVFYHLTDEARAAMGGAAPARYIGQPAGPAYRGPSFAAPVRIVSRAEGARA